MRDNTIRRVLVRNGEVETLSPDEVVVQPMDSITIRIDLHDDERSAEGVGRFLADVSPSLLEGISGLYFENCNEM